MSQLEGARIFATGDSVYCTDCRAVLNCYSSLNTVNENPPAQDWSCEFCGVINHLSLEQEEIPTSDALDYIVMSVTQVAEENKEPTLADKDITVVFCIDISGSMCVTQPIEGNIKLKGNANRAL
jgi:hypothetical protein